MANLFGASGLIGQGLRAGQKFHRINVVGQVLADRPDGGSDPTPEIRLANIPAVVTPLSADEKLQVGTVYATASHEVRVDYTALIDPTVQIELIGPPGAPQRLFDVLAVVNVNERYRELQIVTVERKT